MQILPEKICKCTEKHKFWLKGHKNYFIMITIVKKKNTFYFPS